ncbi:PDR/VanB family oxidoreductase [Rhodococcus tibetensis]|uniref:PDR/VanB family oxidoreductase n=1 Tax=Rhodococcus tibetensis TaxID=2965064 RepID=A0ABT1QF22_9NOCA|nr:PDR/VanB family oxidoreductase [Rhodococcus sp. FXJ9.536]MCQ4120876.1 PDR/VanB family oxidoreductase [Rhodococcus sp. FXJ9.536]
MTNGDLDRNPQGVLELLVQQVTWEADGIASLRLIDPNGALLPAWTPGAHLDLVLPSGKVRQYSLCGDIGDRSTYTIAVLRDDAGRGGSVELHDTAWVGRRISIRGPRNHFPLIEAPSYLFVAGGIGITPILAMTREVSGRGLPWRLVYGGRSTASMAFLTELATLGGENVDVVPQDVRGMLDLDRVFQDLSPGSAVYCCGPEGMIRAAKGCAAATGTAEALHVERFGAPTSDVQNGHSTPANTGNTEFEVELRRTGAVLDVPTHRTLIDVVREAVPDFLSDCEEGYCGACEVRVLEGSPEHRDLLLSETEREVGDRMMICVGRSQSPRLVLDL